ncbi:EmrB/QacA subfamily drug resistance transporter [Streptosporangium album]|uniref:EmrB/QacA subfamily drug resistance transporter n=1 Tax=Streptosporangium album TaxID=47479 RepID=A0A7W7WCF0_9ACTN|nr:MFS transporter [Streptosporangium album]MBB4942031.1 EmrB/QacA subfamily drug resistance transporter [Streptosporangium album]
MPAFAHPATAAQTFSPRKRWAVLAVILSADVLDLLDSTITNIAAPTIAEDLHGGEALIQWLGAGYALALGVLLVAGGRLGDRYGRRRLFLIGITGFTLASIACGLAPAPGAIIVARLVQGAFGALLIPQGFGILGAVFPRDQIGKAFSAFAPVMGISAVGGPLLAGVLIDADILGLGWRSMFLINIVLGGIAILAAAKLLPEDTGDPDVAVDGIGSGLLAAAMLGLLSGLITGSTSGWTLVPIALVVGGTVFFGLFCHRQRTAESPLIKPSLLGNRGFTSGLILGVVFFAAVSGILYALSLFMQNGLGYPPLNAALGLAPIAVGIVIASIASYRLIGRLGRDLVLIGLAITLTGTGWLLALVLTAGTTVGAWALVPPVLIIGLGMGTCFGTIYDVTIGDIGPREAGSASGSLSAVQQLSNAIGAAVVTTVYFTALADGGEARAMTHSLAAVAAVTVVCCGLVRLLPRKALPQDHQ